MMNRDLVEAVINHSGGTYPLSLLRELAQTIETEERHDDFTIEFDGAEYRLISEDDIWGIYKDGIRDITEECYLDGKELPSFLSVDWEETAKNCFEDGYGHHFSGYDGSESESNGWYVFRTN